MLNTEDGGWPIIQFTCNATVPAAFKNFWMCHIVSFLLSAVDPIAGCYLTTRHALFLPQNCAPALSPCDKDFQWRLQVCASTQFKVVLKPEDFLL